MRVKFYPAAEGETGAYPQFPDMKKVPGVGDSPDILRYNVGETVQVHRSMDDILSRGSVHDDSDYLSGDKKSGGDKKGSKS